MSTDQVAQHPLGWPRKSFSADAHASRRNQRERGTSSLAESKPAAAFGSSEAIGEGGGFAVGDALQEEWARKQKCPSKPIALVLGRFGQRPMSHLMQQDEAFPARVTPRV